MTSRISLPCPRICVIFYLILAFFPTACGLHAQSAAVPTPYHDDLTLTVAELTDSDAPIKMTVGKIFFKQDVYPTSVSTKCTTQFTLKNVSWRDVLAYEVLVRATPHYQGGVNRTDRDDGFFKSTAVFVAGSEQPLNYDCSIEISISHDDVLSTPQRNEETQATFKLLYVQFVDGASYGTSEWGERLHEGRAVTIQRLNELLEAYRTGGEDGLRAEIGKDLASRDDPPYVQSALAGLDDRLRTDGARVLLSKINSELEAAKLHEKVM